MSRHKLGKVIFATEVNKLVDALERLQAWPCFSHQISELTYSLRGFREWKLVKNVKEANRGAFLIVQSVTQDCRF